jgi:hypothetical protein
MPLSITANQINCHKEPRTTPWIHSPRIDLALIMAPGILPSIVLLLIPHSKIPADSIPLWSWVLLILCCDVTHVYATLYRTYFSPQGWSHFGNKLISIPVIVFALSAAIYSVSALLFWRIAAYFAVYHFIRQQYGFFRIYSKNLNSPPSKKFIFKHLDSAIIHGAALVPIIYWHTHLPRNFYWFMEQDFITTTPSWLWPLSCIVYASMFLIYLLKETRLHHLTHIRQLFLFSTLCSWWTGIIFFNNDLTFTALNVLSHGIPYMTLVWVRHQKDLLPPATSRIHHRSTPPPKMPYAILRIFNSRSIILFLAMLVTLAWIEEYFWAGFVWREHLSIFPGAHLLPEIDDPFLLSILVPLLTVPQLTHYFLDGVIWRKRAD